MKKKERYSVIAFTGYGCVEVFTSENISECKDVAHRYDDYSRGSAIIYNNVTDVRMDADGNLTDF